MTSAVVTDRSAILNVAMQNVSVKTEDNLSGGFNMVMDKATESKGQSDGQLRSRPKGQDSQTATGTNRNTELNTGTEQTQNAEGVDNGTQRADDQVNNTVDTEKSRGTESTDNKQTVKQDEVSKAGEEAAGVLMAVYPEETVNELTDLAADLIEQAADLLGVSTEDILEAMKQLDMDITDLFMPDKMASLALAVKGEDQTALLTDEALYQTIQDVKLLTGQTMEEAKEALSLDDEAWNGLLAQMKAQLTDGQGAKETAVKPDVDTVPVEMTDSEEVPKQVLTVKEAGLAENNNNANEQFSGQTESGNTSARTANRSYEETSEPVHQTGQGVEQSFAQNMIEHADAYLERMAQESQAARSSEDMEAILKQVMDNMKLRAGDQLSEVEMQLHPASLGTLHISVAAKDGVVTAMFRAETEDVRNALETQVALLKENLEQQGVKVEAVEVTVASHEFERNLEQNAKQEEGQAQEAEARKKNTRRVNLNSLDGIEEDGLSEDERIARDMMMRHGNQIDYLA